MKQLFLFVILMLGVAFALDCSGGKPRCLKSNCNGCCDVNGDCQKGMDDFACGSGAGECSSCAQNQACVDQLCQAKGATGGGNGSDGGCGAQTCFGCCDSTGTCRGGNGNMVCGAQGASCAACPSGQACQQNDSGFFGCAQFTCPGCLSTGGNCLVGTAPNACGKGGGACSTCLSGYVCVDGGCEQAQGCDAGNCAGCCNGNVCVAPPTTGQCGRNGATCAPCSGSNVCNAGVCGASGAGGGGGSGAGGGGGSSSGCNSTSCAMGCCDPIFDTCLAGTSDSLCGNMGATCLPCSLVGLHCVNKSCAP